MLSCSSRQPTFRDDDALDSFCCCSKPPKRKSKAPQKKDARIADSQDEISEADRLVANFCDAVPAMRVLPTEQECDQLWKECADIPEAQISLAFCNQLSQGTLLEAWPAQIRALRALAYLLDRGGKGRRVASSVMASSGGAFVRHLAAEVPECRNDAAYLMLVNELAQSLPSGRVLSAADQGGLLHFTDKKSVPESPQKSHGEESLSSVDLLGISGQQKPHAQSGSRPSDLISLAEVFKTEHPELADHAGADLLHLNLEFKHVPEWFAIGDDQDAIHLNLEFKHVPECFAIGDDQDAGENQDLSQMYSFCQRRAARIPWVAPREAQEITKSADPFDSLAEHIQLMCS